MIVMPLSYSPSAIARSFNVIDEITLAEKKFLIIFDKQAPRAAIVKAETEEIDGVARHLAVAMLELAMQKSSADEAISVERFWEATDLLKIEGVSVDPRYQEAGFATRLYEALVMKCGVILMSDNKHYQGGKALWQKIARESNELSVLVLDSDSGRFFPYDGSNVVYDGASIPEEEIWSLHPDTARFGIVLIAENKRKIDQLVSSCKPVL